jgi:tRNA uridine 5-carboxymethylaminomethyl modification enzyme
VRATRAQADRILYKAAIRRRLENQPHLTLFQQAVDDLMVEGDRVVGAVTQSGIRFRARAVVLTAGTFLDGASTSACRTTPPAAPATRRP